MEPPVREEKTPKRLFWSKIRVKTAAFTPGTVIWPATRNTTRMKSVKRILRRRVEDLQI